MPQWISRGFSAASAAGSSPARASPAGRTLETKDADRPDAGIIRFKHYGVNQDGKQIFEGERTVLMKRRSHWGDK